MHKIHFSEIYKWIIITAITLILGFGASDIELLGTPQKYYVVFYLAIAFVISVAVVQSIIRLIRKLKHWYKSPNYKNIKLYSAQPHNNEILLKLRNEEWRKPFILISKISIGCTDGLSQDEEPHWIINDYAEIKLDRREEITINFIRLDTDKRFSVVVQDTNQPRFELGVHDFTLGIVYGFWGVGNDLIRWFDLRVSYEELNKIKVDVRNG